MIRIQDARPEGFGCIRHHLWRHGVGQVHRQEGNVNLYQRLHLGDILGVPGEVKARIAKGKNISIPGAFRVEGLSVLAFVDEVIRRDCLDAQPGHRIGARAYTGEIKWIKKEYMERTHVFFEKHGGKAIFLARFVPIIRTFAPFVAGGSQMSYGFFFRWNVIGGITWVATFTLLGYFFGNIPFVQKNFELVIIAIVVISVIPAVVEWVKARKEIRKPKVEAEN